jgi:hypothetical protein
LECHRVGSNTQSRRRGGAAALLPLGPTEWRIKPSKIRWRKAPLERTRRRRCRHPAHAATTSKTTPTEERGPRRHVQHQSPEAEKEQAGRLLIPLAATAVREEKPNHTCCCSLPLPPPRPTKEERSFHLCNEDQLLAPLLESPEQRSPPHLAHPTRAPRGEEPSPTGPDLGRRSESPSRQDANAVISTKNYRLAATYHYSRRRDHRRTPSAIPAGGSARLLSRALELL